MKYTTKVTQPQFIGSTKIEPRGGDLTEKQVAEIKANPYGQDLIKSGFLTIEGTKPQDIPAAEPEKK